MLSNKWLCVSRQGTMIDWAITELKEGKPLCSNVHKDAAQRIRISLIKYRWINGPPQIMISHNINMMHNPWIMNIELIQYWFSVSLHTLCIRCNIIWYLKHITRCHWRVCPWVMIEGRMNALIYSHSVSTAKMMSHWGPLTLMGLIAALWLAEIRQLRPLIGQNKTWSLATFEMRWWHSQL